MTKRVRAFIGSAIAAAIVTLAPLNAAMADTYWQCVPFARLISGVQIFGDAHTWWRQAVGKYETGFQPKAGAVLCFKPNGKMRLGHVGVVSQVLTDRVIQLTHANWSRIGGTRGQIERDVTVIDVSPAGDWSQVKVWYDPIRDLGTTSYPTYGFIYPDANAARMVAASPAQKAGNSAMAMVQGAASQVVSSVGSGPLQMLSQAAESRERIAGAIQTATGQQARD
ncbi:MAG TPA: CHAP domain-containing protein [Phenylobacterium sp.]